MNRHICLVFWHSYIVLSSTSVLCDRHICSVLRYSCFVLQARLFSTSTLFLSTVLYLWVPIVLCPSYSLLLVYAGKYLYDVHLNNE